MTKPCVICNKLFNAKTSEKTCTEECRKKQNKITNNLKAKKFRKAHKNDKEYQKKKLECGRKFFIKNKDKLNKDRKKRYWTNPEKERKIKNDEYHALSENEKKERGKRNRLNSRQKIKEYYDENREALIHKSSMLNEATILLASEYRNRWTNKQDQSLITMYKQNKKYKEIALLVGRSVYGIRSRIRYLREHEYIK